MITITGDVVGSSRIVILRSRGGTVSLLRVNDTSKPLAFRYWKYFFSLSQGILGISPISARSTGEIVGRATTVTRAPKLLNMCPASGPGPRASNSITLSNRATAFQLIHRSAYGFFSVSGVTGGDAPRAQQTSPSCIVAIGSGTRTN